LAGGSGGALNGGFSASVATSGAISASEAGGESSSDAAATDQRTLTAGSDGNSSVSGGIYQFGIWLSLLFATLALISIVIWAVVKAVRKNEASQNGEVVYQNLLDARQIYGKITKN
jgi:hypothetical protein